MTSFPQVGGLGVFGAAFRGRLVRGFGQEVAGFAADAVHEGFVFCYALEFFADGAKFHGSSVGGHFAEGLHLLIEAEAVVLAQSLEAAAFNDGGGCGDERVGEILDGFFLGVVEAARAAGIGAGVAEVLVSLEGYFDLAGALFLEVVLGCGGFKGLGGEGCADVDLLIEIGRLHPSVADAGCAAALGVEVAGAVGVELEGPGGGDEAGVGVFEAEGAVRLRWCDGGDCESRDCQGGECQCLLLHRAPSPASVCAV